MIQNLILSTVLVINTIIIYKVFKNLEFNNNGNSNTNSNFTNDIDNDLIEKKSDKNYSNKVIENPVIAPERIYDVNSENNNLQKYLKINERTRGEPDQYQLVGMLYNIDSNKNYNLYGRHTYPGSYEWEYYVDGKDIGGNYFKFPLDIKNEIRDNTQIKLPLSSDPFIVKIYEYKEMKYIPI